MYSRIFRDMAPGFTYRVSLLISSFSVSVLVSSFYLIALYLRTVWVSNFDRMLHFGFMGLFVLLSISSQFEGLSTFEDMRQSN